VAPLPADVVLQRPLKHAFSASYTSWMTDQIRTLVAAGYHPEQLKVNVNMKEMKPLLVKWMMSAWKGLRGRQDMIKRGWNKAGFDQVMSTQFQGEALRKVCNLEVNVSDRLPGQEDDAASAADIEQKYDDAQDDGDEVEEDQEEINIDDALVSIVEERPLTGVRRSSRLQQASASSTDHRLAQLLQEEILHDAVYLPN
jgi:nitrogen fixation/metabolism regulation signal transduction histidine kinase